MTLYFDNYLFLYIYFTGKIGNHKQNSLVFSNETAVFRFPVVSPHSLTATNTKLEETEMFVNTYYPTDRQAALKLNKSRFEEIYNLTLKICGLSAEKVPYSSGCKKRWKDILEIWDIYLTFITGIDIVEQAFSDIQWAHEHNGGFDSDVNQLLNLVKRELLSDGFASAVWLNEKDLLLDSTTTYDGNIRHSLHFSHYMNQKACLKIIHKNKVSSDKWCHTQKAHRIKWIQQQCEEFEMTIMYLLPEATEWDHEWNNETYIIRCIEDDYQVSFNGDVDEFDRFLWCIKNVLNHTLATSDIVLLKTFSFQLAEHIFNNPKQTVLDCFQWLCTFHKENVNGKDMYYYNNTIPASQSWVYRQICQWKASGEIVLTSEENRRLFDIGLDV